MRWRATCVFRHERRVRIRATNRSMSRGQESYARHLRGTWEDGSLMPDLTELHAQVERRWFFVARSARILATAVLLIAGWSPLQAQSRDAFVPVTDVMLQDPDPEDWLMWRRTLNGWGFSPLNQINRDNVSELRMVWSRAMAPGRFGSTRPRAQVHRPRRHHRADPGRQLLRRQRCPRQRVRPVSSVSISARAWLGQARIDAGGQNRKSRVILTTRARLSSSATLGVKVSRCSLYTTKSSLPG